MKRKILKAKCGVELQEDTQGKVFMSLDGFQVFPSGVPQELKHMMIKSFENIVDIRMKDGYK